MQGVLDNCVVGWASYHSGPACVATFADQQVTVLHVVLGAVGCRRPHRRKVRRVDSLPLDMPRLEVRDLGISPVGLLRLEHLPKLNVERSPDSSQVESTSYERVTAHENTSPSIP